MKTTHRKERDFLGEVDIPDDRLFGVNTCRGVDNLTISPRTVGSNAEFRKAFAQCKWAAALANFEHQVISKAQKGCYRRGVRGNRRRRTRRLAGRRPAGRLRRHLDQHELQ